MCMSKIKQWLKKQSPLSKTLFIIYLLSLVWIILDIDPPPPDLASYLVGYFGILISSMMISSIFAIPLFLIFRKKVKEPYGGFFNYFAIVCLLSLWFVWRGVVNGGL